MKQKSKLKIGIIGMTISLIMVAIIIKGSALSAYASTAAPNVYKAWKYDSENNALKSSELKAGDIIEIGVFVKASKDLEYKIDDSNPRFMQTGDTYKIPYTLKLDSIDTTTNNNKYTFSLYTKPTLQSLTPFTIIDNDNTSDYGIYYNNSDKDYTVSSQNDQSTGTTATIPANGVWQNGGKYIVAQNGDNFLKVTYGIDIWVPEGRGVRSSLGKVEVNKTLQLEPELQATDVAVETSQLTFSSSDESIAKVDSNGLVTALKVGEVTITTKYKKDEYFKGTVTIKVVEAGESDIKTDVTQDDNTPKAEVSGVDAELAESVMTEDEKAQYNAGEDASLKLEMTNIDGTVSADEKKLIENTLSAESSKATVGMYFDLSLILKVGTTQRSVSELGNKSITVKFEVPQNLRAPAGVKRTFYLIHIHNGNAKKIASTTSTSINVSFNQLSTIALAYSDDEAAGGFYSGLNVTQKNGKIKVSWDKVEGAAKYALFANYCGKTYKNKPAKTTKSTSVTLKKINGKKIDFTKNFKVYVAAYDSSGKLIGNTISAHFAGKDNKKYKNTKALKLSTKTITVEIGKTSKIKASVKLEDGKKKDLSDGHAAKFRYRSTDKTVATVDKNGNVKGVAAGTCDVYVYSRNGLSKKVKVTVQ